MSKAKTKRKKYSLKLREKFLNEIKNEEKNINEEIIHEFFNNRYPLFLVKGLYEDNQNKNEKLAKNVNESLINLRKSINSKKNHEDMEWRVWITWWMDYSVSDIQDYFKHILKTWEKYW